MHGGTERRIVLADEHALLRAAVRVCLEGEPDLAVAGETSSGREAVSLCAALEPDVAVLSTGLDDDGGLVACQRLRAAHLPVRALVLGETDDPGVLIQAMEAGADGFVSRHAPLSAIVDAVRTVARGETSVPSRMLGALLRELVARRREEYAVLDRCSRLSRREREVLALLVAGRDCGEIAEELFISPQTSRTHIQNVLSKLGVHSRLEAINLAATYDLLDRFMAKEG